MSAEFSVSPRRVSDRSSTTSTRSPGRMNPATPRTSSTRTVTARMPSSSRTESNARWPGAVTFVRTMSSLLSMAFRSEEHTSELLSRRDLVCRLLLEKKKKKKKQIELEEGMKIEHDVVMLGRGG